MQQQPQKEARVVAEIPEDLKRSVAAKAALQGKSLKQVLIELLGAWVETDAEEEPEGESAAKYALAA